MVDSEKRPVIMVADDDLARYCRSDVRESIAAVAAAMGYTPEQVRRFQRNVRFFDEYDGEKGAEQYIKNPQTKEKPEAIALAFVDNRFDEEWCGDRMVQTLKREAEKRGEPVPAMVWISTDSPIETVPYAGVRGSKALASLGWESAAPGNSGYIEELAAIENPDDPRLEEKYAAHAVIVRALPEVFKAIEQYNAAHIEEVAAEDAAERVKEEADRASIKQWAEQLAAAFKAAAKPAQDQPSAPTASVERASVDEIKQTGTDKNV